MRSVFSTQGANAGKSGSLSVAGVLKAMPRTPSSAACLAAASVPECQTALPPLPAQLTFDGRGCFEEFLLIEILNIRRAGPGIELAPYASPSDGRFDIVSATSEQRPRLLRTLKARLKDADKGGSMTTRRARHVLLEVHVPCEMRIDDDTLSLKAETTVEITIKPGALEFLLPSK